MDATGIYGKTDPPLPPKNWRTPAVTRFQKIRYKYPDVIVHQGRWDRFNYALSFCCERFRSSAVIISSEQIRWVWLRQFFGDQKIIIPDNPTTNDFYFHYHPVYHLRLASSTYTPDCVLILCLRGSLWPGRRVADVTTRAHVQCWHTESGDVAHVIEKNNAKNGYALMTSVPNSARETCWVKPDRMEYS